MQLLIASAAVVDRWMSKFGRNVLCVCTGTGLAQCAQVCDSFPSGDEVKRPQARRFSFWCDLLLFEQHRPVGGAE